MTSPSHPAHTAPTRQPAVAGRFYPGHQRELADLVDSLLDAAAVPPDDALAMAYVVPHAGYPYSGRTAALVYARLRQHADQISRVVLVGPAHHVPLSGCAASAAAAWATPLGELPLDREEIQRLATAGHVAVDEDPHIPEHSLEVQLPFLQRALPRPVPLVPILAGVSPASDVAAVLAAAVAPGTVVLCSTDLSHYLDLATADARDGRTAQAVLELAADRIGPSDACGVFGLRGLVCYAGSAGLSATLLHRCTSADATGDTSWVVGYAAFAFAAGPSPR